MSKAAPREKITEPEETALKCKEEKINLGAILVSWKIAKKNTKEKIRKII